MFQLFDYIAFRIHKFLERRKLLNTPEPLPLGFTFGFPVDMVALNKAKLRQWTKHIKVDGVVGNDVVQMLHEAIQRKGVGPNTHPYFVIFLIYY